MTAETRIPLLDPIKGHDGPITELVLRPPKYRDLIELGDPIAVALSPTGMTYSTEKDDVIERYINKLVIAPVQTLLLEQLSLADTMALKDAIHDFFGSARVRNSTRGQSTSSST